MKEKLFIFKGANLSHTSQSSLTNKMANYEDTYVIGNHEDGFCHTDISNVMTPQLTGEETLINVLVDAHGGPERGETKLGYEYCIGTKGQKHTLFKDFLTELVKATGKIPVNMFLTSCYGKNAQNYLDMLPEGSLIVTLSGRNAVTSIADSHLTGMMISTFNEIIYEKGFNIKYLLQAYCANQKVMQFSPVIGIHTKDGVKTLRIGDYIKDYVSNDCQKSFFVEKMISNCIVSAGSIHELTEQVKQGNIEKTTDIKPKLTLNLLNDKLDTLKPDELITWLEKKYYPKNSFSHEDFKTLVLYNDFSKELKKILLEPSHLQAAMEEIYLIFADKYFLAMKEVEIARKNLEATNDNEELKNLYSQKMALKAEFGNSVYILQEALALDTTDVTSESFHKLTPAWLLVKKEQIKNYKLKQWEEFKEWSLDETTYELKNVFENSTQVIQLRKNLETIETALEFSNLNKELNNIFFYKEAIPNYNILLTMAIEEAWNQATIMLGEGSVTESNIDYFA